MANDPVNHPSHYTDGQYETIDFIEDQGYGFHFGNAAKYISRAGKKDPSKETEDLEKAVWYIHRASENVEPDKWLDRTAKKQIDVLEYAKDKQLDFNLMYALGCLTEENPAMAVNYIRRRITMLKWEEEHK